MNPQPGFYAKQLGTDSFHHKHASCLQTKQMPQQNLLTECQHESEICFLPPTKRRLTIVLLATHNSINKSTILWINPIINYQNQKFPTRGVSSEEKNKASLAFSRRVVHLYLPRWSGHLASQPQYSESIYILYILHMLCISTLGPQRHRTTDHSSTAELMCAIIHVVHASNLTSVTVLGDLNKNWKSSHKTEAAPSNF